MVIKDVNVEHRVGRLVRRGPGGRNGTVKEGHSCQRRRVTLLPELVPGRERVSGVNRFFSSFYPSSLYSFGVS